MTDPTPNTDDNTIPLHDPTPLIRLTAVIVALPLLISILLIPITHTPVIILVGLFASALTAIIIWPAIRAYQDYLYRRYLKTGKLPS